MTEWQNRPHLIRNTFRYAARQYWDEMSRDLRPVYTAPSEAAAKERFVEFSGKWGRQYPAITRLWENAWSEFVPFLDYDVEIRRVICSTDAIESVNARYRRAVRARGHFPNDDAATKLIWLALRNITAKWERSSYYWKPALNQFAILYEGRFPVARA